MTFINSMGRLRSRFDLPTLPLWVIFGTIGTLVYPTIDEDFNFSYRYKNTNHMIYVTTVNLNQDWEKIETRIKEIVGKR